MRVRRKTPILEARQFTEESAVALIKDGWLSDVGVVNGEAWGRVTRSVTRSREILLNGWIVLEQMRNETVKDGEPKATVAYFRPLSPEQFAEDFEVVDDSAKRADHHQVMGLPANQELLDEIQGNRAAEAADRALLKNMPCDHIADPPDTSSGEVAKAKK